MASFLQTLSSPVTARAAKVSALLVLPALIAGALGWQALQFVRATQQLSAVADRPAPPSRPDSAKRALDEKLLGLFGSADQEQLEQAPRAALPESNLDLQISAIFFMTPPEASSVIIEDGNKTLILKPGEEARPGISIAQIESNRVTFKRNGKLEQLSFRGFGDGESEPTEDLPLAAIAPSPSPPPASEAPMEAKSPSAQPTAYQQFIQRKLAQNK